MNTFNILLILLGILFFLIIVFKVLKHFLQKCVRKWPVIIWIIGIAASITAGIYCHWIVSVLAAFITLGILFKWQMEVKEKCFRCHSYNIELISKEGKCELWRCNNCGQEI